MSKGTLTLKGIKKVAKKPTRTEKVQEARKATEVKPKPKAKPAAEKPARVRTPAEKTPAQQAAAKAKQKVTPTKRANAKKATTAKPAAEKPASKSTTPKKQDPAKTKTTRKQQQQNARADRGLMAKARKNKGKIAAGAAGLAGLAAIGATSGKKKGPTSHKIKSGDTLSQIAKDNGTTVKALMALNGIKNPHKIFAGKSIKLGTPPTPKATNPYKGMKKSEMVNRCFGGKIGTGSAKKR